MYLFFDFIDFLRVLVEYVFAHKLWALKLLARKWAQPLVLGQLLGVGYNKLFHFTKIFVKKFVIQVTLQYSKTNFYLKNKSDFKLLRMTTSLNYFLSINIIFK